MCVCVCVYIYIYMCVCVYFTAHLLFFYIHDYFAQMLYVLTDKQIYGEVFHEKLHDLQSFCWSRNSSPLMQPTVHWRRNCPPSVLILSQTNPIRDSKIFNIHFNVILQSTPRHSKQPLPFKFTDCSLLCICIFFRMYGSSHVSWLHILTSGEEFFLDATHQCTVVLSLKYVYLFYSVMFKNSGNISATYIWVMQ